MIRLDGSRDMTRRSRLRVGSRGFIRAHSLRHLALDVRGIYSLILLLGVFSCAVVVLIAMRMDVIDHEAVPLHITFRSLLYWPWLLLEIVKANIDVTKRVLGLAPISPTMIRLQATQKTDLGLVIFANSITLTPGTISIDVEENGEILVHAISARAPKAFRMAKWTAA